MATLSVSNLSMVFENGFQALNDISLEVEAGQLVTLLGPSGCGKTTLLKLIAGFLAPTTGTISMHEKEITFFPPEKRDTAMVFQSYALFPHMQVQENITFGLKQKRVSRAEQAERLQEVLSYVSLEPQKEKYPKTLSGGQQQRVALARALAMRPEVILFDEPLSNLDAKLREQVRFEIRKLQREQGFTAIYVTHDQAEALAMSDKIFLMNAGEIVQAGAPHEIYDNPVNRFVADFLGVANIFEGNILADQGDGAYRVSTPFGELDVHSKTPPQSQHVHMCWRPEHAELVSGDGIGRNHFQLKAVDSVFLGNLTDVFAQIPGQDNEIVRVQFLQHHPIASGESLHVSVAPHHIHFLESVS